MQKSSGASYEPRGCVGTGSRPGHRGSRRGGKLRYEAPAGRLTPELRAALSAHKAGILAALAAEGVAEDLRLNLPGISPELAARLSPEDLADIAAGDIPLGTVQAFEQAATAREAEDLKEFFEERAGILDFDACLPKPEAELEAGRITATLARNCGYLWASLRAALAGHPCCCPSCPPRPATWTPGPSV